MFNEHLFIKQELKMHSIEEKKVSNVREIGVFLSTRSRDSAY